MVKLLKIWCRGVPLGVVGRLVAPASCMINVSLISTIALLLYIFAISNVISICIACIDSPPDLPIFNSICYHVYESGLVHNSRLYQEQTRLVPGVDHTSQTGYKRKCTVL